MSSTAQKNSSSRDAEAVRRRKDQTRTLLFADCRNPFADVAIAARMRQILHTHQGRDKVFKCIMYFLRIYMWVKNIKLNFMFIEGASEESFTLVERNYMTIMNSRRLFRIGRFVGEWVRIQVTLLKSSQLIYAPSKSRSMSYFVQLQMLLDVLARMVLFVKCITDDVSYISQKGFLHSSVAGKLLKIGGRLAVPVMTSDLFLNSLNLAQRILDSRHVVSVKENPEYLAYCEEQQQRQQQYLLLLQQQQLASQNASITTTTTTTTDAAAAAAMTTAVNPYASFETLPKASVDDFQELLMLSSSNAAGTGAGGAGNTAATNPVGHPVGGSMRNLRAAATAAGLDGANASTFLTTREGHHSGVAVGTIFSSPGGGSGGRRAGSNGGVASMDSVHIPTHTPAEGENDTLHRNSLHPPTSTSNPADTFTGLANSSGKGMRTSASAAQLCNTADGGAAADHCGEVGLGGFSIGAGARSLRKSKSTGAFAMGSAYLDSGVPPPPASPIVLSAAVVEDTKRQQQRVGRSFSLLYTLNDLDRKRKNIQKQQEEVQQQQAQHAASAAAAAATIAVAAQSPTTMGPCDFNSLPSGGGGMPHHHHQRTQSSSHHQHRHYSSDGMDGVLPAGHGGSGGQTPGHLSPSFIASPVRPGAESAEGTGMGEVSLSATNNNFHNTEGSSGGLCSPVMGGGAYHHRRTQSGGAGLRSAAGAATVVGGGNLASYVHALSHPHVDPNSNLDERDAVMKAAEENDLLALLTKNDGDDTLSYAHRHVTNATSMRHLQGAGTVNRTYAHRDHHHGPHHHADDGEASTMIRVKSEAWTEEQILEGTFSAPREQRLKAIATTIAAQRRLQRAAAEASSQNTLLMAEAPLNDTSVANHTMEAIGDLQNTAATGTEGADVGAGTSLAAVAMNALSSFRSKSKKKNNSNNNNKKQQQQQSANKQQQQSAVAVANAGGGDASGLNDDSAAVVAVPLITTSGPNSANATPSRRRRASSSVIIMGEHNASSNLADAVIGEDIARENENNDLLNAFRTSAGSVDRSVPGAGRRREGGGGGDYSLGAAGDEEVESFDIAHSGPSSLVVNTAEAQSAAPFACPSAGGGAVEARPLLLNAAYSSLQQQRAESRAVTLATTTPSATASISDSNMGLLTTNGPRSLQRGGGAPTHGLNTNALSSAALLRMAIAKSVEAYTREVSSRDGLTPVSNYAQLLWRDYELHWACVTQLKLVLDYYVLLSVVFGWEGVRGRTAIMGLLSGLLSVYRVFVYGR